MQNKHPSCENIYEQQQIFHFKSELKLHLSDHKYDDSDPWDDLDAEKILSHSCHMITAQEFRIWTQSLGIRVFQGMFHSLWIIGQVKKIGF